MPSKDAPAKDAPKTFADIQATTRGKPLIALKGKKFVITAAELGTTQYNNEDTPIGRVTVDGEVYYTFSSVLIQQIKDTIQANVPVEVTLTEERGKKFTYQTFA